MSEANMRALFLLAGITVGRAHRLPNGYCSQECCADRPWWLVETPVGLLLIGWRKHVINIDWASTSVRCVVTRDDVTKDECMVHAWGYAKAVEYLTNLASWMTRASVADPKRNAVATEPENTKGDHFAGVAQTEDSQ